MVKDICCLFRFLPDCAHYLLIVLSIRKLYSLDNIFINGNSMNKTSLLIFLMLTFSVSGCSYFCNEDAVTDLAAPLVSAPAPLPLPVLKPLVPKASLLSCEEVCSNQTGIKKKFCVKKCEFKIKKAERKALKEACIAKKAEIWSRIFPKANDSSSLDCRDYID